MGLFYFGDYIYNSEMGTVKGPEQTVSLRPKSHELMTFLIQNPNRILSKEELLGAVWKDRVVVDNVLLQSIREIRNALNDDAKDPKFIKNYPNKGYCWIHPEKQVSPPDLLESGTQVPPVKVSTTPKKRPWPGAILALLGVAAIFTLIWLAIPAGKKSESVPVNSGQTHRLVLLPFNNLTGEEDKKWVELGLMDMVGQALSFEKGIDLVPTYDVQKTMALINSPKTGLVETQFQALQQQLDCDWIIQTQIFKEGAYRVLLTIYHRDRETSQHALTGDDLVALGNEMLRKCMAIIQPGTVAQGLEKHFSEDHEALRDYGIGRQEFKTAGPAMAKLYYQASIKRDPTFLWAKNNLAFCLFELGEWEKAKVMNEEVLAQEGLNARLKASSYCLLGMIHRNKGELEQGEDYLKKSLALAVEGNNAYAQAVANLALGNLAIKANRLDEAQAFFEKCRDIHRKRGNRNSESNATSSLGTVAAMKRDWPTAIANIEQAIGVHREFGDQFALADGLVNLGVIYCQTDEVAKCQSHLKQALVLFEEQENHHAIADVLLNLGSSIQAEERWQEAIDYFLKAIPSFQNTGDTEGETLVSIGLINCYTHMDMLDKAKTHLDKCQPYYDANPKGYGVFHFALARAFLHYKSGEFKLAHDTLAGAKTLPFANWTEEEDEYLATYAKAMKDAQ